ncbi:Cof-type HAD-IIB family hydrolase [Sellimonas catena]|uniref:Haloacid dehalogenase n=1 Tax=Sellimonas catena TaxID=2994035 RepID=A0A9W6CKS3_9FIRM|nr:Cof-type HAD-IIB family hydrolase [Sellimonas catena]GLG91633.1 haloacid dehalogenase [Sellimonas catena]
MREIKMIGLDLDGTLLNSEKKVTKYSEEVLKEAIRQGVTVLVATGRPLSGVPEFMREFPGMRYILTANGARIYDRKDGEKLLFSHLLSNEDASRVLDIFEEYDTLRDVYYDGVGYANRAAIEQVEKYYPEPGMREYIRKTRKRVDNVREKMKEFSFGMDKIQAVFADLDERKEAMRRLKETTNLAVTGALVNNVEVNAAGVNKGNGLLELGKLLGITKDEIMACGDGLNDLVMLQTVGFGVAMANGHEEVKKHADYITLTNEENGVAKAIEKFVLR